MKMTRAKLLKLYKKELADLIAKGLEMPFIRPRVTEEGERPPGFDPKHVQPHTHDLYAYRPFIFDTRKIPAAFHGIDLYVIPVYNTKPPEFRCPERTKEDIKKGLYPFLTLDVMFEPEKVMAYAEEHFLDICAELDDYSFTLKDICNMIVSRDFDEHVKWCEEVRLRRIIEGSGYEED